MSKPIVNPDLMNTDPDYWEEVLKSHDLGMGEGLLDVLGSGEEEIYTGEQEFEELEDYPESLENDD